MIMKLLNHSIKARVLWLLASFFAVLIAAPLPGFYAQKSKDETESKMTWIQQDGEQKRLLEVRGKAEFNDDYTDIKSVSPGGWVIVEERTDRQWFRYEVRRDPAGEITRAFYANGTARPLDESAKNWLSTIGNTTMMPNFRIGAAAGLKFEIYDLDPTAKFSVVPNVKSGRVR